MAGLRVRQKAQEIMAGRKLRRRTSRKDGGGGGAAWEKKKNNGSRDQMAELSRLYQAYHNPPYIPNQYYYVLTAEEYSSNTCVIS
ncbi:hypothetical protein KSP40_PGU007011 [Platanthera guangdongensis]|uniref:Uncharacterized protein n=1 Tax=Platanthera guangdongensis TaxID=2320717 RepID=A0ABR2MLB4_9ASPA